MTGAVVKLYLNTGIRLAAGCRLEVDDFRQDGKEAIIRLPEKSFKRPTVGLQHWAAAQAIHDDIERAGLTNPASP